MIVLWILLGLLVAIFLLLHLCAEELVALGLAVVMLHGLLGALLHRKGHRILGDFLRPDLILA